MTFLKSLASYYRSQHRSQYPNFIAAARTINRPSTFHNVAYKPEMRPSLPPAKPRFPFSSWGKWLVGSMLAIILPFWNKKWKSILRIEDELEMVVETVEYAAGAVEKVATATEKMASKAADRMPEDAKLKSAAAFVEHVAQEVAEEAHLTVDIIHKAEELKEEVEKLVEPIEDLEKKIVDKHKKT